MKKKILYILLALMLVLSACSPAETPAPPAETPAEETPEETTDHTPENTGGIVCLAPAYTQVVVDLGLGDQLVAVDSHSAEQFGLSPDDVFVTDMLEPDMEMLVTLEPTVVIASSMSTFPDEGIFDPLVPFTQDGVLILETPDSVEQVRADVRTLAAQLDMLEKGEELLEDMDETLGLVADIIQQVDSPQTVYFEISPLPELYSFGSGVFQNELVQLAGGKNVLEDEEGWLAVTEEAVLAANPDVIFTSVEGDDPVAEILGRQGWQDLPAVANNRVLHLDPDTSSQPNHRLADSVVDMATFLYPDLFSAEMAA